MQADEVKGTVHSWCDRLKVASYVCGLLVVHGALAGCGGPAGDGERSIKQGSIAGWASGGTAAMRGTYPDPFVGASPGPCALTPALTVGPCYVPGPARRDISEGLAGLPMRLSLRVVRANSCEPVANAVVDVWHASPAGNYSAFPAGANSCNRTDPSGGSASYFRGTQTTDANGRVDFDTVFPGWYGGRTVHVHYTVRVGGADALTSQLLFDDALTTSIMSTHPDYRSRSLPDTTNDTDALTSGGRGGAFFLQTARMSDGALQAWRTIAIPSSP